MEKVSDVLKKEGHFLKETNGSLAVWKKDSDGISMVQEIDENQRTTEDLAELDEIIKKHGNEIKMMDDDELNLLIEQIDELEKIVP